MKIATFIPGQKVVWHVLDNYFNFTKDKSEWTGTNICFDIFEQDGKTHICFTHEGLHPQYECYDICSNAWTSYLQHSLKDLIIIGKGQPNPIEEVVNEAAAKADELRDQHYQSIIMVSAAPEEAFNKINAVNEWWSTDFAGSLGAINDVFTVRFGEVYITSRVVEWVPDRKIVWEVIESDKPWLKDKKEWNGTRMSWEISRQHGNTQILFTHIGLVPPIECFDVCANAWDGYLQHSLPNLINSGKGQPTTIKASPLL